METEKEKTIPPHARRKLAKALWAAVIVTAVISVALTWIWLKFFGASAPHPATMDTASQSAAAGKRIAYWRAPMNPMEIYNAPGKSKMGMDLVPVYEDELVGGVDIKIDPVVEQNMGIRTATVEKGPIVYTIRTYGHITYDETRTALVTTKVDGWLDHLYVNFTGEIVEAGQPLFEIYSPQLLAAQEEYLTAFRNFKQTGNANREFLSSARRRLSYFDIADSEIKAIETANDVKKNIMVRSPYKGVVTQKNAVEGGFVKAGTTVYMLADLSRVWVEAHIFEYELGWVAKGQEAVMTLPYLPGKTFRGKVAYVYPYLQRKTRDVVIRLEFPNPDAELKPDMYADVRIDTTGKGEGLIIPAESVIRSGERNVVFVSKGNGRFVPRQITLGMGMDGGRVQVLKGLAQNEIVVTSGQFMLDSESTLKEAIQKMMDRDAPRAQAGDKTESDADFFKDMKTTPDAVDDFFQDMK
ncbi:MAG: efflux RND transporter periplasmic adaptor subunit [Desulfatirhabdiaceae bacterium]